MSHHLMSDKQTQSGSDDDPEDDEDEPPTLLEQLKMAQISVKIVVMIQRLLM